MKIRVFLLILFLPLIINAQPNLTLDSIVIKFSNDTVYVWDYNAWEQCGFQLDYEVQIVDSVITITQIDTAGDMTTCYGYHNFVMPFVDLPIGSYRIDIYRDCLFQDIRFIKSFWFSNNLNGQHIFPLHIGDRWIYWEYPTYFSEVTIQSDTTMTNGEVYYSLNGEFYRQHGDSVFKYDYSLNDEYLIFDFSAEVGDTITNFEYGQNDTLQIVLTYKYENGEYLGVNGTYYTFFINQTQLIDDEISLSVFDSLGIIKRYSTWFNESLSGAVIDGTTYGNITSVGKQNAIVQNFVLTQNYPNPFNPTTKISWQSPVNSWQTLKIYDVLGREVATLVDEYRPEGKYEIELDAANLSSGVYMYRMVAENYSETKKMILLK